MIFFCFNKRCVQTQHPKDRMCLLTLALFFVQLGPGPISLSDLHVDGRWMGSQADSPSLTHIIVFSETGSSHPHCLAVPCFEQMDHVRKHNRTRILPISTFICLCPLSPPPPHPGLPPFPLTTACFLGVLVGGGRWGWVGEK